jgi:hypothetical protein
MIPKPGGGERALGIPTMRDRVAQIAAKLILDVDGGRPDGQSSFLRASMSVDHAVSARVRPPIRALSLTERSVVHVFSRVILSQCPHVAGPGGRMLS